MYKNVKEQVENAMTRELYITDYFEMNRVAIGTEKLINMCR
jgi:hypothetical protein